MGSPYAPANAPGGAANLADILERVLDKGVVIAGDIQINLLDIELLTIKLRLLVASVDKAKEMGIDWWEHDPSLSSRARPQAVEGRPHTDSRSLAAENARLREELGELRAAAGLPPSDARDPLVLPEADAESEDTDERRHTDEQR
jgi:hypothetical protein